MEVIDFGVWRSLVARCVRDAEAVSSNLATPIPENTALLQRGVFRFVVVFDGDHFHGNHVLLPGFHDLGISVSCVSYDQVQ